MNYYRVMGLSSNASEASIRRAFRCHAKRLHPDVNSSLQAKHDFQLVNEAYQVLIHSEKRRLYDLRLTNAGISQKEAKYRSGQRAADRAYAKAQGFRVQYEEHVPTRFEKIFDNFLFFFMLMVGIGALFYGIYNAFNEPVEGVNPYLGIVFGFIFTGLFVLVWDKMQRVKP